MLDENRFWEIIEKNKENPIKLLDEVHDYSLEDMYGFFMILQEQEIKSMNDFMLKIEREKICDPPTCGDDMILKGKEFYDCLVNKDEEKLLEILKEYPNFKKELMTINDMYNIGAIRITEKDSEEYKKLKSLKHLPTDDKSNDAKLIYNTFLKFLEVCKSEGISDKYKKNK